MCVCVCVGGGGGGEKKAPLPPAPKCVYVRSFTASSSAVNASEKSVTLELGVVRLLLFFCLFF